MKQRGNPTENGSQGPAAEQIKTRGKQRLHDLQELGTRKRAGLGRRRHQKRQLRLVFTLHKDTNLVHTKIHVFTGRQGGKLHVNPHFHASTSSAEERRILHVHTKVNASTASVVDGGYHKQTHKVPRPYRAVGGDTTVLIQINPLMSMPLQYGIAGGVLHVNTTVYPSTVRYEETLQVHTEVHAPTVRKEHKGPCLHSAVGGGCTR